MNQQMAVTFLWILGFALAATIAIALFAVYSLRKQQVHAGALERELRDHETALEQFSAETLPLVASSAQHPDAPPAPVDVPAAIEHSRFAQQLRALADSCATALQQQRIETTNSIMHEAEEWAQKAIKSAEDSVRLEIEGGSREAASAAVRSFSTSVVSLGADVSQVVSTALREHRDDAVYETLIRIDHSVQQMIRQAQSYVIVCGGLPGRRWPAQSLTDVVGGATGRVRDYLRVRAGQLDRTIISRAVEPLVHTIATLLDNALRYSPPTSFVDVTFQEGHHGVTIIIDDAGVRMNAEQIEDARQVLANKEPVDIHRLGPSPKVGFPGIAALAHRYGFTVYIDGPNAYGGMRAMVYIPEGLLAARQNTTKTDDAAATSASSAPDDTVESGLPKRRRKLVVSPVSEAPRTAEPEFVPARSDIAAAWQSGTRTGRAAASDPIEGMTS